MTNFNIDKLENEAMARLYDTNKPDELNDNKEEITQKIDASFFKISRLLNDTTVTEEDKFHQCFRYIKMIDCDWQCHYLLLLNHKVGMLIPNDYLIIYDSIKNNNLNEGKVQIRNGKEFIIEYREANQEDFNEQIKELNIVSEYVEHFIRDKQIFYEFDDKIYMYYEGYIWTISGYTRNDIKEYFDMYLILMSIRCDKNKCYTDNINFKSLYLISKNALNYLYRGIDLKRKTQDEINSYELSEDVVSFAIDNNRYLTVIDENYQIYHRKIKDDNNEFNKINIYNDTSWKFEGTFKASILGTYNRGHILEFPEIVNSSELSEIEKRNLLENVINQKQIELYEYKDLLSNKLINNLIDDLKENLTFDKWNEIELVNYLYIENIDIENKTDELLYDYFKYALDNNDVELIKSLIDIDALSNSIKTNNIVIGPEFMAFAITLLNKNKTYILFENNEFIEWK